MRGLSCFERHVELSILWHLLAFTNSTSELLGLMSVFPRKQGHWPLKVKPAIQTNCNCTSQLYNVGSAV